MFNQEIFVKEYITKRATSFFVKDIEENRELLSRNIRGKIVLVIGGAGTIGSSFIKALLPFKPSKLIVVDYNENELTELTRDLRSEYNDHMPHDYITYPFDFGGTIFEKLFKAENFDIVACFAAHKHVRSEKDHLAIEAMIRNNIFNTNKLLTLCKENPPEHFFSVSTDKAANPVNVMGASKKIMEKVLMSFTDDFKVSTARFANVAFSNGSLLYGFNNRISKRQPISAPSDVKRYFVSPRESGQLCLLACVLGKTRDIFFPKLDKDQMMTFSDIAVSYLKELGLDADFCKTEDEARTKASIWTSDNKLYPVYFFKTETSGEKPFEEFIAEGDLVNYQRFKALGVINNGTKEKISNLDEILESFKIMFENESINKAQIIDLLNKYLPDFNHKETGKNLDQKL